MSNRVEEKNVIPHPVGENWPQMRVFDLPSAEYVLPSEVDANVLGRTINQTDDDLYMTGEHVAIFRDGAHAFLNKMRRYRFFENSPKKRFPFGGRGRVRVQEIIVVEAQSLRDIFLARLEKHRGYGVGYFGREPNQDPYQEGYSNAFQKLYESDQCFRGAAYAAMQLLAGITGVIAKPEMTKSFTAMLLGVLPREGESSG